MATKKHGKTTPGNGTRLSTSSQNLSGQRLEQARNAIMDVYFASRSIHDLAFNSDAKGWTDTAIANIAKVVCLKCEMLRELVDEDFPEFGGFRDEFHAIPKNAPMRAGESND